MVSLATARCAAHGFVFLVYLALRFHETTDAHSGYDFPWSPWRLLGGNRTARFELGSKAAVIISSRALPERHRRAQGCMAEHVATIGITAT